MESREKLFQRIRQNPKHVSYDDLVLLLRKHGFVEANHGNHGSHHTFKRGDRVVTIVYRRPHVGEVDVKRALQACKARELSECASPYLVPSSDYRSTADWESMEASWRRALELEPDNTQALQSLGRLLVDRERPAEGIPYLRRHLRAIPDSLETVKALCNALRKTGGSCEAQHIFADAWQRLRTEDVGIEYGGFLIELGELAKAETELRDVAACFPTARARTQWATALSRCDRDAEAAEVLEGVNRREPSYHPAWCKLAFIYDRLGLWEKALTAAQQAMQLEENHYESWRAKATVLLSVGRYYEAVQAARRGRELIARDNAKARPQLYDLYYIEVVALAELGHTDQALQRLAEVCSDFPDQIDPVVDQAELLYDLKRYDEAVEVARRGCKLMRRDNAQANSALLDPFDIEIMSLVKLGHTDRVLAAIQVGLEVEPELRGPRLSLSCDTGMDQYRQGQPLTALAILELLHHIVPDHARALNDLAFLRVGQGNCDQAERAFQHVLDLPDAQSWQPTVWLHLSYIYLLRGAYEEAAQALHKTEDTLVVSGHEEEMEPIARVAYWREGRVLPEYTPFPTEPYPIRLSAQANRVTLLLAQGQVDLAEDVARQLVKSSRQRSLGYRMLGYALLAQARNKDAAKAWRQALRRAKTREEESALKVWLAGLA